LADQDIDELVRLAHLTQEEVHALKEAPAKVRQSQVKGYIIVFLIVVILFF
jgi:hypothetical protein